MASRRTCPTLEVPALADYLPATRAFVEAATAGLLPPSVRADLELATSEVTTWLVKNAPDAEEPATIVLSVNVLDDRVCIEFSTSGFVARPPPAVATSDDDLVLGLEFAAAIVDDLAIVEASESTHVTIATVKPV